MRKGRRISLYYTKWEKVSTANCRYSKNATAIDVDDAKKRGYTPCGVCKP